MHLDAPVIDVADAGGPLCKQRCHSQRHGSIWDVIAVMVDALQLTPFRACMQSSCSTNIYPYERWEEYHRRALSCNLWLLLNGICSQGACLSQCVSSDLLRTGDGDGEGMPLHACAHEAHDFSKPHIPLQAVGSAALHCHCAPSDCGPCTTRTTSSWFNYGWPRQFDSQFMVLIIQLQQLTLSMPLFGLQACSCSLA